MKKLALCSFAALAALSVTACDSDNSRFLEEKPDSTVLTIPADFARVQGQLQCSFDVDLYVLPNGTLHGDVNRDGKIEGNECR